MQKLLNKVISIIPFIMLGMTLICAISSYFDFYIDLFMYLPDLLGYSILTNMVFLYHFSFNKYCNVTRAAVWGLLVMNLVSIFTMNTDYYSSLYDLYIISASIFTMIIFKIKRW